MAVKIPETQDIMSLDGLVKDVNTGAVGDAQTYYTYFDLMAEGFCSFSLQYKITATTLTLEATNDAQSVADASAEWFDVSTDMFPGGAASVTATGACHCANKFWSRMRVKALTTNASNALELRMSRGR